MRRALGSGTVRIPTLIVHSSTAFYGPAVDRLEQALSAALEVRGVRKEYGSVAAVDDLTFEIDAGEILGVLGPNGAGKTTAIRVLTTILAPTRGEFAVAGIAHTDPGERLRRPRGLVLAPHPLSLRSRQERLTGAPRDDRGSQDSQLGGIVPLALGIPGLLGALALLVRIRRRARWLER
jgi:hypothetical protein